MSNVTPLKESALTPELLLRLVAEDMKDVKHLFIIGYDSQGQSVMWSTPSLDLIPHLNILFQDLAIKWLNGYIVHDAPPKDPSPAS